MPIQVTAYGQFRLMFRIPKLGNFSVQEAVFNSFSCPSSSFCFYNFLNTAMSSDGANEEPYASEYAEKGSPTDSDNDEGTNVEHNASLTKLNFGASLQSGFNCSDRCVRSDFRPRRLLEGTTQSSEQRGPGVEVEARFFSLAPKSFQHEARRSGWTLQRKEKRREAQLQILILEAV